MVDIEGELVIIILIIIIINLAPTMTTIITRASAKLARLAVTIALAHKSKACS